MKQSLDIYGNVQLIIHYEHRASMAYITLLHKHHVLQHNSKTILETVLTLCVHE